jgi:hypothetical protein
VVNADAQCKWSRTVVVVVVVADGVVARRSPSASFSRSESRSPHTPSLLRGGLQVALATNRT